MCAARATVIRCLNLRLHLCLSRMVDDLRNLEGWLLSYVYLSDRRHLVN